MWISLKVVKNLEGIHLFMLFKFDIFFIFLQVQHLPETYETGKQTTHPGVHRLLLTALPAPLPSPHILKDRPDDGTRFSDLKAALQSATGIWLVARRRPWYWWLAPTHQEEAGHGVERAGRCIHKKERTLPISIQIIKMTESDNDSISDRVTSVRSSCNN